MEPLPTWFRIQGLMNMDMVAEYINQLQTANRAKDQEIDRLNAMLGEAIDKITLGVMREANLGKMLKSKEEERRNENDNRK
jgi:hypothetical protein